MPKTHETEFVVCDVADMPKRVCGDHNTARSKCATHTCGPVSCSVINVMEFSSSHKREQTRDHLLTGQNGTCAKNVKEAVQTWGTTTESGEDLAE